MSKLNEVFDFITFLNKYRAIERTIYVNGTDRMEDDAEHSFQLSMLAWYLADNLKLDLDISRVLKFTLAHDLVETYAGDTSFWNLEHGKTKKRRELDALLRIEKEYGEKFPEMIKVIKEYESSKTKDKEASFVYALDKFIPMVNIYLDNGRSWKDLYPGLKLEKAIELKKEKIQFSKEVTELFDELIIKLRENKNNLFIDP